MAVPGSQTEERMARNVFVVSRRHPDLYEYLRERFATDQAVEVILDRRIGQRRGSVGHESLPEATVIAVRACESPQRSPVEN